MIIKVLGEMPLRDIEKALIEKLNEIEDEFAIRHSRGATLYINPTNGFGDDVEPRRGGKEVKKVHSFGPYPCAADDYEP